MKVHYFRIFGTYLCLGVLLAGCAATSAKASEDWQEGIGLWVIYDDPDGEAYYDRKYKYERVGDSRWKVDEIENRVTETLEVKNTANYAVACKFYLSPDGLGYYKKRNRKADYRLYVLIEERGAIDLDQKSMLEYRTANSRKNIKPGPKYSSNNYLEYVVLGPGESFVLLEEYLKFYVSFEEKFSSFFRKDEWVERTACISMKQDSFFD